MKKVALGIISRKNTDNKDEYLLVSTKLDYGQYTGFYYPPGGYIAEGEDEQSTLVKKIKNEINLDVEPIRRIAKTPADIPDQVTYWWECQVKSGDLKIMDPLVADAKHFTLEQMKDLKICPATERFFNTYISQAIAQ